MVGLSLISMLSFLKCTLKLSIRAMRSHARLPKGHRVFSASLHSCRNGLVFGDAGTTASGTELAINFVD